MQVLVPIQEHNEFGFNIIEITKTLKSDSVYQRMSNKAYQSPLDYSALVRAIATFERSLISGNSAYDKFQFQGKQSALTGFELAGLSCFLVTKPIVVNVIVDLTSRIMLLKTMVYMLNYRTTGRERLTKKRR